MRPEIDNSHIAPSDNIANEKNQLINIENLGEKTLSKRQQKKLLKLAQWEIKKKEKRQKEREKYKQKRLEAIAKGEPTRIGPSRKALKHNKIANSSNPFQIAIDLDFDDLMIDKDICKCAKQLLWVYTINRKSKSPLQLYYTGLKDSSRLQKALERNDGYQNWDVKICKESYLNVFTETENIIYLTSDSDDILTELNPNCVYIIGGLVDHNHHKGLTLQRATKKGIKTARLPLSENVSIKTRTVLTIVHGKFTIRLNKSVFVYNFETIYSFKASFVQQRNYRPPLFKTA